MSIRSPPSSTSRPSPPRSACACCCRICRTRSPRRNTCSPFSRPATSTRSASASTSAICISPRTSRPPQTRVPHPWRLHPGSPASGRCSLGWDRHGWVQPSNSSAHASPRCICTTTTAPSRTSPTARTSTSGPASAASTGRLSPPRLPHCPPPRRASWRSQATATSAPNPSRARPNPPSAHSQTRNPRALRRVCNRK